MIIILVKDGNGDQLKSSVLTVLLSDKKIAVDHASVSLRATITESDTAFLRANILASFFVC